RQRRRVRNPQPPATVYLLEARVGCAWMQRRPIDGRRPASPPEASAAPGRPTILVRASRAEYTGSRRMARSRRQCGLLAAMTTAPRTARRIRAVQSNMGTASTPPHWRLCQSLSQLGVAACHSYGPTKNLGRARLQEAPDWPPTDRHVEF